MPIKHNGFGFASPKLSSLISKRKTVKWKRIIRLEMLSESVLQKPTKSHKMILLVFIVLGEQKFEYVLYLTSVIMSQSNEEEASKNKIVVRTTEPVYLRI